MYRTLLSQMHMRDALSCVLLKERMQETVLLPKQIRQTLDEIFMGDLPYFGTATNSTIASYFSARVHDAHRIIREWEKVRSFPVEKTRALQENYRRAVGNILGYAPCCVEAFTKDRQHFKEFLGKNPDPEVFAAVPYVPCTIDCAETRRRDYSKKIAKKHPELFEVLVKGFGK